MPVLVVLLRIPGARASVLAAFTFFLACWSDFLDGYLARRHGITSRSASCSTRLADKLIVMAALVMLAAMPREPRVPAWIVVLIVGRELAVTGLRAVAVSEGIVLAAEELGKYKMIFQMLALHGLAAALPLPRRRFLRRRDVLPLALARAQRVVGRRLSRAGHSPCDSPSARCAADDADSARLRAPARKSSAFPVPILVTRHVTVRCAQVADTHLQTRITGYVPCNLPDGMTDADAAVPSGRVAEPASP